LSKILELLRETRGNERRPFMLNKKTRERGGRGGGGITGSKKTTEKGKRD